MPLTTAEKEAYARVGINVDTIWTIELRHSTFPAPLRIVNHDFDITHTLEPSAPADAGQSVLFSALAFDFEEPSTSGDPDALVRAQIDGVTGLLQPYIAAAGETVEAIEATLRELTYDVADQVVLQQPSTFHLQVRQSRSTMVSIAIEMARINSANLPFPNVYYTPASNPALQ